MAYFAFAACRADDGTDDDDVLLFQRGSLPPGARNVRHYGACITRDAQPLASSPGLPEMPMASCAIIWQPIKVPFF